MIFHLKLDVKDVSDFLEGIDVEEEQDSLINYALETASLIIDRVIDMVELQ